MAESRMQRGQKWLEQLLMLAKFPANVGAELQTKSPGSGDELEPPCYWLTIDQTNLTQSQIQVLIGIDGATLDAVQYLANAILNLGQPEEQQAAYTVELDGYRVRRQAELRSLAESAVQQVRQTGKEYVMEPLSAAERRQVHTFLKDFTDLESYSRGKEPDRRLVIRRREVNMEF